jgi:Mlc titration factor MtfA (ptsG expression regulator)/Tfp pilus assembly protein PilF
MVERARGAVWQVEALPPEHLEALAAASESFLARVGFEGCGGFVVTDDVRISIAVQASLLAIALPETRWSWLKTVLVYPDAMFGVGEGADLGILAGQSAQDHRTIVLAWTSADWGGRSPGYGNVVAHEVAHALDAHLGMTELSGPDATGRGAAWKEALLVEFEAHGTRQARRRACVLDAYAAADFQEFFAESTACFLQKPWALSRELQSLHALLADCYGFDPARCWDETRAARWAEPDEAALARQSEHLLSEYDAALERHPDSLQALLARAQTLEGLGRTDEALAAYRRTAALRPEDAGVLHEIGHAFLRLGRPEDALAPLDGALHAWPGWALALHDRGCAREETGDLDRADRDFAAAGRLDPGLDLAWYGRARVAAARGRWQDALAHVERALALVPDDADYLGLRARAHEALGSPRDDGEAT